MSENVKEVKPRKAKKLMIKSTALRPAVAFKTHAVAKKTTAIAKKTPAAVAFKAPAAVAKKTTAIAKKTVAMTE